MQSNVINLPIKMSESSFKKSQDKKIVLLLNKYSFQKKNAWDLKKILPGDPVLPSFKYIEAQEKVWVLSKSKL